jgi:hypothetical protein
MRSFAIAAALLAFSVLATDASGARVGKRQLWGAIAYNGKTGAFGYAIDRKTKREAETEAFSQCGSNCDLIKTFRDSCGVVAVGGKRVVWDTGASREIAETKALRKCGGDTCKIAVWACTSEK